MSTILCPMLENNCTVVAELWTVDAFLEGWLRYRVRFVALLCSERFPRFGHLRLEFRAPLTSSIFRKGFSTTWRHSLEHLLADY